VTPEVDSAPSSRYEFAFADRGDVLAESRESPLDESANEAAALTAAPH
jgi:hypothetical protein